MHEISPISSITTCLALELNPTMLLPTDLESLDGLVPPSDGAPGVDVVYIQGAGPVSRGPDWWWKALHGDQESFAKLKERWDVIGSGQEFLLLTKPLRARLRAPSEAGT